MSAVDDVVNLINEVTAKLEALGSKADNAARSKAEQAIATGKDAVAKFEAGGIVNDAEAIVELSEASTELSEALVQLGPLGAVSA
ncbi:MAG: hypothetical protein ACLGJC_02645 [Alphaproteobacteria bacterium]